MLSYLSVGLDVSPERLDEEAEAIVASVSVPVLKALRSAKEGVPGALGGTTGPLTAHEARVLSARTAGTPRAETARELGITIHGVNSVMERITQKLGARNQMHAYYIAVRKGWI